MYVPQINPLHLYRALLRESTYLFDPIARICCEERVRTSFRRKRASKNANTQWPFPGQNELHQLKRARKFLSLLQRANLGHRKPVENVLALAYARKGARRHKIISKFKIPEDDKDTASLADRDWQPSQSFRGLLKAQKLVNTHLERSGKITSAPDIPTTNRLGDPFPQCRVKKVNRTWYAKHANLLSAPLPGKDWIRVASHVYGQSADVLKPVPRRTRALQKVFTDNEDESFTQPKLLRKTRMAIGNPHQLSPRFLRRRLHQTVLANAPAPLARLGNNDTVYRWAAGPQVLPIPQLLTDSQRIMLFE